MSRNTKDLPPPSALQAALRKTTEALATELACPTRFAPDWSDFEWTVARAVASMHGVSPLLSRALRWQGPDDWTQFLDLQRAHTAARHRRAEGLLQSIDVRARALDIAVVALKGSALHAMGIYACGDRPMADIDLLVRPADAERTVGIFGTLGFREQKKCWKERCFVPVESSRAADLGEHGSNDLKLELHVRICERLPLRITDVSDLIFATTPKPGLNSYPSNAALMTHLLFHAAGAMAYQSLRLLHLHDIAQLSSRMNEDDWNEFLESNTGIRRSWWAFPPLNLCSRYYSWAIPKRTLVRTAEICPYFLARACRWKTLYDVSYSYLWVDAFPGIEWAQSIRELFDYALSRVRPDAEHIAERERIIATEVWAGNSSWNRLSHGRRILRWMASRPTRPLALHSIRAALAQTR